MATYSRVVSTTPALLALAALTACGANSDDTETAAVTETVIVTSTTTATPTPTTSSTSQSDSAGDITEVNGLEFFLPDGFEQDPDFDGNGPFVERYVYVDDSGVIAGLILVSGHVSNLDSAFTANMAYEPRMGEIVDDYVFVSEDTLTLQDSTHLAIRVDFEHTTNGYPGTTWYLEGEGQAGVLTLGLLEDDPQLVETIENSLRFVR